MSELSRVNELVLRFANVILILDHNPAGFHLIADKKVLQKIGRRCSQILP